MACNCNLMNGGIAKFCGTNIGGISKMYITDFCNITSFTDSSPVGQISAITMVGATVYYEFEFNRGTSTWTEANANDPVTGTTVWTQTATLVLNKRERTKREALALMLQKELSVIVKDNNGQYWILGKESGVWATAIEAVVGTAKTDPNRYTVTLVAEEPTEAYPVDEAAVLANI